MSHDHDSTENLKIAFWLNFAFSLLEVIGGLWTNSIAILSDALHDFGDSLSLGFAWYFDRLSRRGRTPRHTYGYRRYRLLGGLITGLVLICGLIFILGNAFSRLLSPESVNAPGMMLLAIVGILFNGAAVLRVRQGSSLTEKLVTWHLIEDILGWVAVFIGSGVMTLWDVPILDPILSIGIALIIIWNVSRNLKKVFAVFLQSTPASFDLEKFEAQVVSLPKVLSTHHTHGWSIDGESHVLTTHLVMAPDTSRERMLQTKQKVHELLAPHNFEHIAIDIELQGEPCGHDLKLPAKEAN